MLAIPSLTHVLCLLSAKTNSDFEKEARRKSKCDEVLNDAESRFMNVYSTKQDFEKEARRKSKCDEELNDAESHYMIGYSHPTSCCSRAHSTQPAC